MREMQETRAEAAVTSGVRPSCVANLLHFSREGRHHGGAGRRALLPRRGVDGVREGVDGFAGGARVREQGEVDLAEAG